MLRQVRAVALCAAVAALTVGTTACQRNEAGPSAATPGTSTQQKVGTSTAGSTKEAGPRASGKAFEVSVTAPDAVPAGERAELVVNVQAKPGFKVNDEYPHSFRPISDDAGATFEATRYELWNEQTERTMCQDKPKDTCAFTARVPFGAGEKGPKRIAGTLAFSVCNPEVCLIEKVPVAVAIEAR